MNPTDIKEALDCGISGRDIFKDARCLKLENLALKGEYYRNYAEQLLSKAEQFYNEPVKTLKYSSYKLYDTTGSRKEFEREYRLRRERLTVFALLALIYEDKIYIDFLQDMIWTICDEYSWCVPAHMGGRSVEVIGSKEGKDREHHEIIDIFAADTGIALTEICSLLGNRLDPLVIERVKKEVNRRILKPYMEINTMFWWETCRMNWVSVCAGSIGMIAMYMIEEPSALAAIIHKVIGEIQGYIEGYSDDGVCTEGMKYWNFGFGYYVFFSALLLERTKGKINLFDNEKVEEIAKFQQKAYLDGDKVISFSDTNLSIKYKPGITHYLKNVYTDMEIPDSAARADSSDYPYRWVYHIRNLVYYKKEYDNMQKKDAFYCFTDSEWIISKKALGKSMLCFAAKGGHNAEPHNHNDIGSFIFHASGESFLAELGAAEYTKQYFGEQRYESYCAGSQGHSVPVVEGHYQKPGEQFASKLLEIKNSEASDYLSLDIAPAYGNKNLKSLIRNFTFYKNGKIKLSLRDEYDFHLKPQKIEERFISFYKPELSPEGEILLIGDRGIVTVSFDINAFKPEFGKIEYTTNNLRRIKAYIISLHVLEPQCKNACEVSFEYSGYEGEN